MFATRGRPTVKVREVEPHMVLEVCRIGKESGCWPSEAEAVMMPLSYACIGAHVAGRMVGYAYYERVTPTRWRLEAVVVAPGWRRCGVGRALVGWIAAAARGHFVSVLVLAVSEWEDGAHRFLRACGFRATGVMRCPRGPDRYRFKMDFRTTDEPACKGVMP